MFARACRLARIAVVSGAGAAAGGFNEMKSWGGVPTGVVDCIATGTHVSEDAVTQTRSGSRSTRKILTVGLSYHSHSEHLASL